MTKAERIANMIGVVVPFLGLVAAIVLLWNSWVDWIDIGIMVAT
jgi:stearoyl-CoA desaturase (delta-9 desaturase)